MTNRGATPEPRKTSAPAENGAASPIDRPGEESPPTPKGKRPTRAPQARRRKAALSIAEASAGMLVQRLNVRPPDVVFVKGIIEASEGVAIIFAERGGELTIAAPKGRGDELTELLEDIALEVGGDLGILEAGPPAQAQKTQKIQKTQKMRSPAEGVRDP